jgi:hypothetical protein
LFLYLERIFSFEKSRPGRVEPVLVIDLLLFAGLLESFFANLEQTKCNLENYWSKF